MTEKELHEQWRQKKIARLDSIGAHRHAAMMRGDPLPELPAVSLEITAAQVAVQIRKEQEENNKRWRSLPRHVEFHPFNLPPKLPSTMFADETWYVHNVGPWCHTAYLGSWGTIEVPSCPVGQEYVTSAPITLMKEPLPVDNAYDLALTDSRYVAAQVLITGTRSLRIDYSMAFYGMFVGMECPSEVQLSAAKEQLKATCEKIWKEAEVLSKQGDRDEQKRFITIAQRDTKYVYAAQVLGYSIKDL